MSYNGSGTFVINSAGQPVVTGTVISSTAFNALTADLATGLSTAITKDGQTTTTSRILFAQGISSTLVTDATSTTTGSIITAGGISTQKALWVGTTSNFAGAISSSAGISNGTAGQIANSISQNSLTSFQVTNSNAGAAAQASYRLYNGNTIADLSVFGTAFTTDGVKVANGIGLDARAGGSGDLALLGTTIRFAVNNSTTEVARFEISGQLMVGTTSNLGSISNQAPVIGGLIITQRGSVSVGSAATVTMFSTTSLQASYLVHASINVGDATNYACAAWVLTDGTSTQVVQIRNGANGTSITASGQAIRFTNGAIGTQTVYWGVTRIGYG